MVNLIAEKLKEILDFVNGRRTARLSRGNVRMQREEFAAFGDLDKAKQNHMKVMKGLNMRCSTAK